MLFAYSTIISWSYYGEQGVIYLFGQRMVMPYRVVYCALIMVSVQLIRTQDELDMFSTFGTGIVADANHNPGLCEAGGLVYLVYRRVLFPLVFQYEMAGKLQ